MRPRLPAVVPVLVMLLLASALPAEAGSVTFRDGFEKGLGRWKVSTQAEATVAAIPAAASTGALGLRVASPRGVAVGVSRRLAEPLDVVRVTFDLRRHSAHGARVLVLKGDAGIALAASLTAAGRLRVAGPGWRKDTSVVVPLRRWVRLGFQVDVAAKRVTVSTDGIERQVIRGRSAPFERVELAGGPGPRVLSFDRFILSGEGATTIGPDPDPEPDPTPQPTPTPAPTPDPESAYRFAGRGSDHGVGMSQAGAVGRARAGQGHPAILAHYYQGTTLDTRAVEARTVRVLVLEGASATDASPLVVCGRRGRWTVVGSEVTFPKGACARFSQNGAGARVQVLAGDGTMLYEAPGSDHLVEPSASVTLLDLPARGSRSLFRGALRVLVASRKARAVNHIALGDYLRGVVPIEMSPSRPAAALRAQAIAARSYALYQLRPTHDIFDLFADTRHQAYGGAVVEAASSDTAITETAGQVVTYGGKVANTLYFAAGGGATEDARNVFTPSSGALGTDIPFLRGSLDVDEAGQPYDAGSGYDSWRTGSFTLPELSKIMAQDARTKVGPIKKLVMTNRGVSGRLISVTLVGLDGTRAKVAGWYFKSVFNRGRPTGGALLSTLFSLKRLP
jgi:stage II sporulation protein D